MKRPARLMGPSVSAVDLERRVWRGEGEGEGEGEREGGRERE